MVRPTHIAVLTPAEALSRSVSFAASGFKPAQADLDELKKAKAYAARHGLSLPDALKRMDDPVLVEIDEAKAYAREKGISITEAFILKGIA